MKKYNLIYTALMFLFTAIAFTCFAVEMPEQYDDTSALTPEEQQAFQALAEFRTITENIRQIEYEKGDLLERLAQLKGQITGRTYFTDRIRKAAIEKIIVALHDKMRQEDKLLAEQKKMMERIVRDEATAQMVQKRIQNLEKNLETMRATHEPDTIKTDRMETELITWQRVNDVIQTAEEYGVEEVLEIINTLPPRQPSQPRPVEKARFSWRDFRGGQHEQFIPNRMIMRLNKIEQEVQFMRRQLDTLEHELQLMRNYVENYSPAPPHPQAPPELEQVPKMPERFKILPEAPAPPAEQK